MKSILWSNLDQTGAVIRALAAVCWLGMAFIAHSWRLPLTAIAAVRRRRAAGGRVRVTPVSRTWLREHEADHSKHKDLW
jgi:hypothetical protein